MVVSYCKNLFTFFDLFAGIGGFRVALEQLGGRCLGHSEIDKACIETYNTNFSPSPNYGDIRVIDTIPSVDLLTGGVPCQPWSVAGKNKGFNDTRGKLWFDAIRLVKNSQPKSFIFENVKGMASKNHKESLEKILFELRQVCGYYVDWKILNSSNFGTPQERERIFLVGIRDDISKGYKIPSFPSKQSSLSEILSIENDPSYNGRDSYFFTFSDTRNGINTIHSWDLVSVDDIDKEICLALLKNRRKKMYGNKDGNPLEYDHIKALVPRSSQERLSKLFRKEIIKEVDNPNGIKYDFKNSKNSQGINGVYRIFLPESNYYPTLTATKSRDFIATKSLIKLKKGLDKSSFLDEIYFPKKFRSIVPEDAKKLQCFPKTFIPHPSDTTALKQFGNSVTIPVIEAIAKDISNKLQ